MSRLERKIKDRLQEHKVQLDTEALWSEVYPQIKPEKNRKPFLFLLLGIGLLLTAGLIGWQSTSATSVYDLEVSKIASDIQPDNILPNNDLQSKQSKISESSIKTHITESDTKLDKVNKNSVILSKSNFSIPQPSTNLNNTSTLDLKTSSHEDVQPVLLQQKMASFKGSKPVATKPTKATLTGLKIAEIRGRKVGENPVLKEASTINSITELQSINIGYLEHSYNLLKHKFTDPEMNFAQAEDFNYSSESKLSIYGLASGYAIDKILSNQNSEPSSDLARRLESESTLESIAGEVGVSYQLTDRLSISSGINYLRINERISANYSTTDIVDLENVIIETINSPNGTESVYGNVQAERTINTELKAYNKYNDLALSFDLRYLFISGRFSPYASLGIQQSIISSQRGYWLLNNNSLYDIDNDENGYIKNSYGLGLRLSLGGSFALSDRTSLILSARHIRYPSSFTNDLYDLQQKYNLLGINAGLSFKL